MTQDDYAEAAFALTDERGVEEWLARTEVLALQHGEIVGSQSSKSSERAPFELDCRIRN